MYGFNGNNHPLYQIYLFLMPPVYLAGGLFLILSGTNPLVSHQSAIGFVMLLYGVFRLIRIFFQRTHAQSSQE